jgi:tetratricopeptide (TPR) repeat protein
MKQDGTSIQTADFALSSLGNKIQSGIKHTNQMTPEEIRKQMMGSAGLKEEDADNLYIKADACFKNQSYQKAFALAKRAADQGHATACNLVGICYEQGLGVEKHLVSAKTHFERAAKGGSPQGMRNFALTAIKDEYGAPDYALAVDYLNKAEAADDFQAPGILGWMYLNGKGVEKDVTKAIDLLRGGSERGDQGASLNYAWCLKEGVGVEKSLEEALKHAKALQEKGDKEAEGLVEEIEATIAGKPLSAGPAQPQKQAPKALAPKQTKSKSIPLAVVLAFFFGPFGLFYVSWKRALAMLLIFMVGISLIPNNGFVTLLLWLVAPVASIFAFGLGPKQSDPQPDEEFWSGKPPSA